MPAGQTDDPQGIAAIAWGLAATTGGLTAGADTSPVALPREAPALERTTPLRESGETIRDYTFDADKTVIFCTIVGGAFFALSLLRLPILPGRIIMMKTTSRNLCGRQAVLSNTR